RPRGTPHRAVDGGARDAEEFGNLGGGVVAGTVEVVPRQAAGRFWVSGKLGGQRVGQAQVDLQGPVPGDRLVRSHGVVLGPVVVGVRDEGQDVVDLFEEEPLVLQGAEPAFA